MPNPNQVWSFNCYGPICWRNFELWVELSMWGLFQIGFGLSGKGRRKKLWNSAIVAVCWSLWLERNKRMFEPCRNIRSLWIPTQVTLGYDNFWFALWIFNTKDFKDLLFTDLMRDRSLWLLLKLTFWNFFVFLLYISDKTVVSFPKITKKERKLHEIT